MNQQATLSVKLAMASQHQANGNYRDAAALYRQVLEIDPGNVAANFAIANRLLKIKRDGRARGFLEKVIAREPDHFLARLRLMEIAFDHGEQDKQSALLNELLASTSQNSELLLLGDSMRRMSIPGAAIGVYERCLEISPWQYEVHCRLGSLYHSLGNMELAVRHLQEAIGIDPDRVQAYSMLWQFDRIDEVAGHAAALHKLYQRGADLDDPSLVSLNYSLGRMHERAGDTGGAFRHYLEASNSRAGIGPYALEQTRKRINGIRSAFSKQFFLETPLVSSDSSRPIFIVGIPGSGTTLVEQILSSHPRVFGAGSLGDFEAFSRRLEALTSKPFYEQVEAYNPRIFKMFARRYLSKIRALSEDAERVTDKTPQNFLHIGLIRLVFPNARIIHCRRNPLDTCLSLFTSLRSRPDPYPHDLASLGHYYGEYARLMRHWHEALPFRIYDVQYEELVADSEAEIRALLRFCELPFDPSCLEFHKNSRAVASASALQVRRPVYRDSVHKWTRFEQQLTPLIEALIAEGALEKSRFQALPVT